jgi:hypothetical protein
MIAIDIASSEEIAEIDSNAKRSPCKKSNGANLSTIITEQKSWLLY